MFIKAGSLAEPEAYLLVGQSAVYIHLFLLLKTGIPNYA